MASGAGKAELHTDVAQKIHDSTQSILPTNEVMKKLATVGKIGRPSLGIFGSISS